MATDINDTAGVTAYIEKLDEPKAQLAQAIREVILNADGQIGEQIKWNAPSFFYTGDMKPFNPKEYKRIMIVFNFYKKDYFLLIFPSGIKVDDGSGFMEGTYTDGRRLVRVNSLDDLNAKADKLKQVINNWLKQVE